MSEILNNNGTVTLSLEEYNELRDELASAKEKLESLEGKLRDYENDPTSKFVIITKETYYDPYMDDDVTENNYEFKALDEFKEWVEASFSETLDKANKLCDDATEKLTAQAEEYSVALKEIVRLKNRSLWQRIFNK